MKASLAEWLRRMLKAHIRKSVGSHRLQFFFKPAPLTQLVECWSYVPKVAGSIPALMKASLAEWLALALGASLERGTGSKFGTL